MIDTHIHLEFDSYDKDRDEVISWFFGDEVDIRRSLGKGGLLNVNAKVKAQGKAIITIGVDEKRIEKAIEIANGHEKIFAAVGFHPQEATDLFKKEKSFDFVEKIRKFAAHPKVVAIGEIGLDYFHPSAADYDLKIDDEIKEVQREVFVRQLEIARELKKPVIVHSWESQADAWEIMQKFPDVKMVFHCYGRGIEIDFTKEALKRGNLYFSFTGNVTFPKPGRAGSEIFEHLKLIPLERIMVETDGPFLAPNPFRGKRNEPIYVKYVIEKIAQVKGLSFEEVEKQTDENAVNFFRLVNKTS